MKNSLADVRYERVPVRNVRRVHFPGFISLSLDLIEAESEEQLSGEREIGCIFRIGSPAIACEGNCPHNSIEGPAIKNAAREQKTTLDEGGKKCGKECTKMF